MNHSIEHQRRSALLTVLGLAGMYATTITPAATSATALIVRGDRLYIDAAINGRRQLALLDSAAELSVVHDVLAAEIGLTTVAAPSVKGTGGEQKARFAKGITLDVAGQSLRDLTLVVTSLQDVSARLLAEPIQLIVGRELFDAQRIEINIERATLRVVKRSATPMGVRLPLKSHAGIESIPVNVEGVEAWADFDLGNGGDVLVGRTLAQRLGWFDAGRIVGRVKGGGLGGEIERDVVEVSELTLAGRVFEKVRAQIDPRANAAAVNVGARLLRNFGLTVDYPARAVWLQGL